MNSEPVAVAGAYFAAWKGKDFEALQALLAEDVTFKGPLGTADNRDQCIAGLKGLGQLITDIVIHRMFVNDADVITWFDLHTSIAGPVPVANWSHIENGKITRIRAAFDPRDLIAGRLVGRTAR
jgi:ketosteroid isomerase-like protein